MANYYVVPFDGFVWFTDDSVRYFPCTAQPHVSLDPLYPLGDTVEEWDGYYPDPALVAISRGASVAQLFPEAVRADHCDDLSEEEAWEELCGNCLI